MLRARFGAERIRRGEKSAVIFVLTSQSRTFTERLPRQTRAGEHVRGAGTQALLRAGAYQLPRTRARRLFLAAARFPAAARRWARARARSRFRVPRTAASGRFARAKETERGAAGLIPSGRLRPRIRTRETAMTLDSLVREYVEAQQPELMTLSDSPGSKKPPRPCISWSRSCIPGSGKGG